MPTSNDELHFEALPAVGRFISGLVIGAFLALPVSFLFQSSIAKDWPSFIAYFPSVFRYILLECNGQQGALHVSFAGQLSVVYGSMLAGAIIGAVLGGWRLVPLLIDRDNPSAKFQTVALLATCLIALGVSIAETVILREQTSVALPIINIAISVMVVLLIGFVSDCVPDPFVFRSLCIMIVAPVAGCLLFLLRSDSEAMGLVLLTLVMLAVLKGLSQPLLADISPRGQRSIVAACWTLANAPSTWFLYRGLQLQQATRQRIDLFLLAGIILLVLVTAGASTLRQTSDNRQMESYEAASILRNRIVWRLFIIAFATGALVGVVVHKIFAYGVEVLQLAKAPVTEALVSPDTFSLLISAIVGGVIIHQICARVALVSAFVLLAIGCAFGAFAQTMTGFAAMAFCICAFAAIIKVVLMPAVLDHAPSNQYGLANGLTAAALSMGSLLVSFIFSIWNGNGRMLWGLMALGACAVAVIAGMGSQEQDRHSDQLDPSEKAVSTFS